MRAGSARKVPVMVTLLTETSHLSGEAEADTEAAETGGHRLFRSAPDSVSFRKLRKRLIREVRETLNRYSMVEPGTRWLVGLSAKTMTDEPFFIPYL